MNWRKRLVRRELLRGMLALVGATAIQANTRESFSFSPRLGNLQALVETFENRDSARYIGFKYLEQHPDENDLDLLAKKVLPSELWHGKDRRADVPRVIAQTCSMDFEHGRLVDIDGWLLSQTEARLCAIAALS